MTGSGQKRRDRRFKQWCKTAAEPVSDNPGSGAPADFSAYTRDLSLGGAQLHSKERFEVGTVLRLQIELTRPKEILNVNGRVKWVKPNEAEGVYEMGIEFLHSGYQSIASLIKSLHGMRV